MVDQEPWLIEPEIDVPPVREQWRKWGRLFGPLFGEMLTDPEVAIRLMEHPNAEIRAAAIAVSGYILDPKAGSRLASLYAKMAVGDPAEEVRCAAIFELAKCYRGTDDVEVGRLLAEVVLNDREAKECRKLAYRGLRKVRGRIFPSNLNVMEKLSKCPGLLLLEPLLEEQEIDDYLRQFFPLLPLDRNELKQLLMADWDFVRSFLAPGRVACPEAGLSEEDKEGVPEPIWRSYTAYIKARTVYDRGRYEQCVSILSEGLAVASCHQSYLLRGGALLRLGRISEAIADFSRAIQLQPLWPRAYRCRAMAWRSAGLDQQAEADEDEARRLERLGHFDPPMGPPGPPLE